MAVAAAAVNVFKTITNVVGTSTVEFTRHLLVILVLSFWHK